MATIEDLLDNGIALVPIPLGEKGPRNKGWNNRRNVITTIDQMSRVSGINIGIAHAYCSPNPTCAIDLDDLKESRAWFLERGIDLLALLYAEDAVVIHSGKMNSLKLLYKLPDGIEALLSKQIKAPSGGMIVEFRCASATGLTVQDVLPPSTHPSGTKYRYIGKGSILDLPEIPNVLFQLWVKLIGARFLRASKVISVQPETNRAVSLVMSKLMHISARCDYSTYRDVVWAILSTGWDCAEDLAKGWCMSAYDRFDEANFINVVNSFNPNVPNSITLGTLDFLAKKWGWSG